MDKDLTPSNLNREVDTFIRGILKKYELQYLKIETLDDGIYIVLKPVECDGNENRLQTP